MSTHDYLYGIHAARNAIQRQAQHIRCIYLLNQRHDQRLMELIQLAKEKNIICHSKEASALQKMVGDVRHQGVVIELIPMQQLSGSDLPSLIENTKKTPLFLLLDGVQDPHNLGACLRVAETAGVTAVIVPKDNACPLTPAARKVASGAAEIIPLIYVTNLSQTIRDLQQQNVWIYGACERAEQTIYQVDLHGPIGIVMGAEEKGLRQLTRQRCDGLFSIPMQGEVSSLNVSVATGICLFEAVRQRIVLSTG